MLRQLSPVTRNLLVICAASALWAFSFGAGAPPASLWLKDHGCGDTLIGLNTGAYYLGIALAAPLVPWMMRRWGRGCILLGMLFSGVTVALFPWGGSLWGWFALRFLDGVAGAMSLIPMETEVNQSAPPEQRSRNFGVYAVCVALGIAAGNWLGLQLYPDAPRLAFVLGGASALVAAGFVGLLPSCFVPPPQKAGRFPEIGVGRNVLSFGSAWSQGFLEGGMVGHLAVYLLFLGLSENAVGWLIAGIMVGVIVFQVPVAWLADRLGRTRVLLGCYAVSAAALAALPFCSSAEWLGAWLFLCAACSTAFYPLGMTLLGERVPKEATARANARYLAFNCLGSLTGPAVAGVAMELFGKRALFVAAEAALLVVLGAWGVRLYLERSRRQQIAEGAESADRRRAA